MMSTRKRQLFQDTLESHILIYETELEATEASLRVGFSELKARREVLYRTIERLKLKLEWVSNRGELPSPKSE